MAKVDTEPAYFRCEAERDRLFKTLYAILKLNGGDILIPHELVDQARRMQFFYLESEITPQGVLIKAREPIHG